MTIWNCEEVNEENEFPYLQKNALMMKNLTSLRLAVLMPLFFMVVLWGCGTTKDSVSKASLAETEALAASRNFIFVTGLVEPFAPAAVTTYNDYMKMKGDTVIMALPYMGTSQVAKMGGGRGGLRFTSKATKIRTHRNEKQNYFDLDFNTRDKGESFTCKLRVFPKGRALLSVNSSQRSYVQYEGIIRPPDPNSEGRSGN